MFTVTVTSKDSRAIHTAKATHIITCINKLRHIIQELKDFSNVYRETRFSSIVARRYVQSCDSIMTVSVTYTSGHSSEGTKHVGTHHIESVAIFNSDLYLVIDEIEELIKEKPEEAEATYIAILANLGK